MNLKKQWVILKPYRWLLIIFGFIAVTFAISALSFPDNSILPEIFGFALDGFFFVILIGAWFEHKEVIKEKKRKEELHNVLFSQLFMTTSDMLSFLKLTSNEKIEIGKNSLIDNVDAYIKTVKRIINNRLKDKNINSIKQLKLRLSWQISTFENSTAIAGMISGEHLNRWMLITKGTQAMIDRAEEEEGVSTVLGLMPYYLNYLADFLKLEIEA